MRKLLGIAFLAGPPVSAPRRRGGYGRQCRRHSGMRAAQPLIRRAMGTASLSKCWPWPAMHPRMSVAELLPGAGYFTRIFSKAVGPTGKVYAIISAQPSANPPPVNAIAADPAYSNVTVILAPVHRPASAAAGGPRLDQPEPRPAPCPPEPRRGGG